MENIVSDANENFSDIETAEEHSKSLNHEVAERIQGAGEDCMLLRFDCSYVHIEKNWKLTYPSWWLWFSTISCFYASMSRFLMGV
jgi:hypothetical protein